MTPPFKVGDVVVPIDINFLSFSPTRKKKYTILKCYNDDNSLLIKGQWLVNIDTVEPSEANGWFATRFKLATPKPSRLPNFL